jgi:HEAT repeat protein
MENSRPHQALDDALLAALGESETPSREDPAGGIAADGLVSAYGPAAKGGDPAKRAAALEALARGGSRNLSGLVSALRSPDDEVVMYAASALGETRDSAAVPHLIRLLQHPNLNVAQVAIDALGKLRAPSAAAAIEAMLEADPWLRFAAMHALGEIGHPGSVHALMRAAEDASISEIAVEALGKIATVPAVTVLAEMVCSRALGEDFEGCLLALGTALGRLDDRTGLDNSRPWQNLASEEASEVHSRLVALLVQRDVEPEGTIDRHFLKEAAITVIRSLAIPALYPALIEAAWDLAISGPLLDAVVFAGLEAHPFVLDGLDHEDADVRVFCCTAAAAMGIEEAAAACEALLTSSEARVRVAALRALAALGADKALPSMIRCLADPSEPVSGTAVQALGAMDTKLVTGALLGERDLAMAQAALVLEVMRIAPCSAQQRFILDSLEDERAEVRRAAVAVLAASQSAEVTDLLEPLLRDPRVEVRGEAILALGQRRSRKALALLLETFEHDGSTRDASLRAIGRIGDGQAARRLIDSYPEHDHGTRLRIIDALGAMAAPSAEPFLAELLSAPLAEVRIRAVAAIGRYATDGAVTRLVHATRDVDPGVRLAAIESLSALSGRPAAIEAFERLCLDAVPAIAALARRSLRKA